MKSALMAFLAILILGAGGAGAYFYFQKPAEASIGETAAHEDTHADSYDDEHGGKHGAFVELDPLILPIIDSNGVSQVVSLVIVLEVESERKADKVRKNEPRLKDAYIQALYGVLNKHAALDGGVIKVDVIKDRLQKISRQVMGDDMITGVLLQVVQQRPV